MRFFVLAITIIWIIVSILALSVTSPEAGRAVVILNIWLAAYMVIADARGD